MSKSKEVVKTSQPLRVKEISTGKKVDSRHAPYKKGKPKAKGGEEETRPKFRASYKELITILEVTERLRFPQKADRNLGSRKDLW